LTGVQNTEEEAHKLLDYYVHDRGGNFIDVGVKERERERGRR